MSTHWRTIRRRLLTPNIAETRLETRGFTPKSPDAQRLLETVGQNFVTGFGYAAGSATPNEAAAQLEDLAADFRGFAYEGATMGFAIMDGFGLARHTVPRFLNGPAARHIYMANIGVGWAMARLPKWRWKTIIPEDPILRWLVLDGYGFHQAYFRTERYVRRQYRDDAFPWPPQGPASYANRVIDQGIGRALWFVEGTDPQRVAATIATFALSRRSDLYSGAGLAATYAGGVDRAELDEFYRGAGNARPWISQACAFAAKARILAGLTNVNTRLAAAVFCGTTAEAAAAVTDDALVDLPPDGPVPAFEVWRERIAMAFESHAVMLGPRDAGAQASRSD
jgi:hypothetical protein